MPEFEYEILCHIYRNPGCYCLDVVNTFLKQKKDPIQTQDLLALLLEEGYICTGDKASDLPQRRVRLAGHGLRSIMLHDEQHDREKDALARESRIRDEMRLWQEEQERKNRRTAILAPILGAAAGIIFSLIR